jgi:hypothetical protein
MRETHDMSLAAIRAKVVTQTRDTGYDDLTSLAIIYLADTLESALHEVAEKLNDLGTSIETTAL